MMNYILLKITLIIILFALSFGCQGVLDYDDSLKEIYGIDKEIKEKDEKAWELRKESHQKLDDSNFDKAKELMEQLDKVEVEIKLLKKKLDDTVQKREEFLKAQSLMYSLNMEISPQYAHFDNKLDLEASYGTNAQIYLTKEILSYGFNKDIFLGFDRHCGFRENYWFPVNRSFVSTFLGFRSMKTHNDDNMNESVQVSTYEIGVSGLVKDKDEPNSWLKSSLSGGVQRYSGSNPSDTGPFTSFGAGYYHLLANRTLVGMDVNEMVVWTKANQNHTHAFWNFSVQLGLRFDF
jgi:hypothetical protein